MYTIRSLTLLSALVLSMVACTPATPASAVTAEPAVDSSIPEAAFQDYQQVAEEERVPLDGPEFEKRLALWQRAWETQNIDAYPYPPSMDTQWQSKYPYFDRLDCNLNIDGQSVSCTFEAQEQEIDEINLISWLPYLSNRDALNPLLICTGVCLNQDGVLVGAVQPEMSKWMAVNKKFGP